MNATERALANFHEGYSCAQSVFAALASELDLPRVTALRLASGMGAGIGRMRLACGAFTGLVLVSGYVRGNETPDPGEKERIFALVRELAAEFTAKFGSLTCSELLRLAPGLVEGPRPGERNPAYYRGRPCEACIAFCAAKAEELLRGASAADVITPPLPSDA